MTQHVPTVVAAGLAVEARTLAEICEWEPCGALLDELVAATTGHGALTRRDVRRLRTWASNWSNLVPQVRQFYASHHGDPAVHCALWYVLGTCHDRPSGAWLGRLRRCWEAAHGHPPAIDLLPTPATQEPPWRPT